MPIRGTGSSLVTDNFVWEKRPWWHSPPDSAQLTKAGHRRLHLYDGGIYDNLGLDPFFDTGRCAPKPGVDFIIVSDAGAPLAPGFSSFSLNPWRLKRVSNIMSDQSRALRVRSFMNYIELNPTMGAYAYIGAKTANVHHCQEGYLLANFPTTLRRVTKREFDWLAGHGFSIASTAMIE